MYDEWPRKDLQVEYKLRFAESGQGVSTQLMIGRLENDDLEFVLNNSELEDRDDDY